MKRQAGMQPGSTSPKAGRYQRAKPLTETEPARAVRWRIPKMRRPGLLPPRVEPAVAVSDGITVYYANENGSLYEDASFSRPTALQIFERADDGDDEDEDEDDDD